MIADMFSDAWDWFGSWSATKPVGRKLTDAPTAGGDADGSVIEVGQTSLPQAADTQPSTPLEQDLQNFGLAYSFEGKRLDPTKVVRYTRATSKELED